MTQFEVLSQVDAPEFPEEWYDHSDENHFWIKWRMAAYLNQISSLDLSPGPGARGLDIGCAHGIVQRQLEDASDWTVDGCDLNRIALEQGYQGRGRNLLYDIHDRRGELKEFYDFLVLFDVIEHIEDTESFLESALYHLKPNGLIFVNVPALQPLYSRYDVVAGHVRRYNKVTLSQALEDGGARVVDIRFWGLSLIPLLMLRKALLMLIRREDEDVIRFGFKPPSALVSNVLTMLMKLETALVNKAPIGASLLAVAQKT